jgi:hypothetical protein
MWRPWNGYLAGALLCAFGLAHTGQARAQETPGARPGERVRVTSDRVPASPLIGTLVGWEADTLRIKVPLRSWNGVGPRPFETIGIPTAALARVEVHRGVRRNRGRSALVGALIGGVLGGVAAGAGAGDGDFYDPGPGAQVLGAAAFGAGIGALLFPSRRDVWEPVPLTAPVDSVTPPVAYEETGAPDR